MKRLLAFAVMMACLLVLPALAQEYPAKQVRVVLPFPAGGGSDLIARVVAQKLTGSLGQPVLVDNRAGASGNIAGEIVARAPADGYTLLFGNSPLSISPAVFHKLNFDPVKDILAVQWNGFFAPARTPQSVIDRLHREVAKTVHLPDVKQRFDAEGAMPVGNSPGEFAAFFKVEAAKWADVARKSGTKLD